MRPFTATMPKCLLPIQGKPFIDYQLDLLKTGGIRKIVLCIGYLGEMVRAHLPDGANRGLHIEYAWDSVDSGGTAGALKNAETLLDPTFFLTWGDSYVRVDHSAMFAAHCAGGVIATMGVHRNQNAYDSSNVEIRGNKVVRYAKGSPELGFEHIDAGLSVLERTALDEIPSKQDLALDPFFSSWAASGRLGAYPVEQRFYETGSWTGLRDFEKFIANGVDSPA